MAAIEYFVTFVNADFLYFERSKEIDWQPYFTTRLVDNFATHLRVFRKAQQRITEKNDLMEGNA